jgi:hypothetical protein
LSKGESERIILKNEYESERKILSCILADQSRQKQVQAL